jgi:CMP/dCMP kinase
MPSANRLVIAMDGPAGAGKSTVAKLAAQKLGLPLLDTGAMYRCVGLLALRKSLDLNDEESLGMAAEACVITFRAGPPLATILDGEDVSREIRTMEVSQAASLASVHSRVRRALVSRQKAIVAEGGVILEGRDTTTVVAPQADVKVFLTASAEERARRRWLEMRRAGDPPPLHEVVKEVITRDHRDYTRDDSPLCLGEDVFLIETFGLAPEQVAHLVVSMAEDKLGGQGSLS